MIRTDIYTSAFTDKNDVQRRNSVPITNLEKLIHNKSKDSLTKLLMDTILKISTTTDIKNIFRAFQPCS